MSKTSKAQRYISATLPFLNPNVAAHLASMLSGLYVEAVAPIGTRGYLFHIHAKKMDGTKGRHLKAVQL